VDEAADDSFLGSTTGIHVQEIMTGGTLELKNNSLFSASSYHSFTAIPTSAHTHTLSLSLSFSLSVFLPSLISLSFILFHLLPLLVSLSTFLSIFLPFSLF
jgi:hypothetical protein